MSNPSISSADRTIQCPASAALPQVGYSNDSAERGTVCHRYLEEYHLLGREGALNAAPEEFRPWLASIDLDALYGDYNQRTMPEIVETAFALDAENRNYRIIQKNGHRNYGDTGKYEWVGTCDYMAYLKDDTPVVVDWKTGARLEDAEDRNQLKFFATIVHLMTGATIVKGRFVYIAGDGSFYYDEVMFTGLDFEELIDTLKETTDKLTRVREIIDAGGTPDVNTGEWCRYCKSFAYCPAKRELLGTISDDFVKSSRLLGMLNKNDVGLAYTKYLELKDVFDKLEPFFREHVYQYDVPLPNKRYLTTIQASRSSLSNNKLVALSKKLGATDEDINNCNYTNTYYKVVTRKDKS